MEKSLEGKKIAIVADWLTSRGGAEHVVIALSRLFPNADIFTSVYNPVLFSEFKNRVVHTSFLQKLPKSIRNKHQFLVPFFPRAFRSFDMSEYDVIISSSSSGFSKCVRKVRSRQIHICYCHTPVRFLYHARAEYIHDYPLPWWIRPARLILPFILYFLMKRDLEAVKFVDFFVANSDFVGKRINQYYHRDSVTIYPGVQTKPFVKAFENHSTWSYKDSYFLAVGRFIPYKRFDLLVETFAKNGLPLKLGGIGPDLAKCQRRAEALKADNIEFLGFVDYKKIPDLFAGARAFMFPVEEDFGLTPVEAMSAGVPIIYYNQGGARESVIKGMGVAFNTQTIQGLQRGIDDFLKHEKSFDRRTISLHGKSFDEIMFQKRFLDYVCSVL